MAISADIPVDWDRFRRRKDDSIDLCLAFNTLYEPYLKLVSDQEVLMVIRRFRLVEDLAPIGNQEIAAVLLSEMAMKLGLAV